MWFTDTAAITLITSNSGDTAILSTTAFVAISVALLAWALLLIIANWRIYEKADEAGWKTLIPFYNTFTYFRIAGRNGWGFLLLLIPLVNIVVGIMVILDIAEHFGKSVWFAIIGLMIFAPIGHLMLGYGSAEYVGQKHE